MANMAADMADTSDTMPDTADIMGDMADITADILARCPREADTRSAEAGRHSAAAANGAAASGAAGNGAAVTGAAATGAAVAGAGATGAAVTGAGATGAAVTDSSSPADLVIRTTGIGTPLGAGVFLTCLTTAIILMGIILRMGTDLVIRTTGIGIPLGVGAFLTCLTTAIILMGIILRMGTIMITIAIPLTVTATPIDLPLRSCSAGWLKRVTTMAPLMESWGRKLVVRFALMNGRTGHLVCANCDFDCQSFGGLTGGLAGETADPSVILFRCHPKRIKKMSLRQSMAERPNGNCAELFGI